MNLPTKSDYLDYFDQRRVPNPIAVTLTMKQRIESNDFKGRFGINLDPIKVSENFKVWGCLCGLVGGISGFFFGRGSFLGRGVFVEPSCVVEW